MPNEAEFLILLLILCAVALASFFIGWHQGHANLRKTHKRLKRAIEESNRIYETWAESPGGNEYQAGYSAGISETLNTLQSFLDRAVHDDDTT